MTGRDLFYETWQPGRRLYRRTQIAPVFSPNKSKPKRVAVANSMCGSGTLK